ncbi:MAG TPA: chemotaxis protein CheA [Thermoanaerobaculia bacterium]|nr:chemotaxis protein CheA [Thermoanaerobaculia bacterium]
MTDSSDQSDLLTVFLAESEENIATIEQLLVALESSAHDEEAINGIFRAAHTLKGNAACLGFDSVASIAHAMEDLLHAMRRRELEPTPRIINLLLQGADSIKSTLPRALAGATDLPAQIQLLLEEMREVRAGELAVSPILIPPVAGAESTAKIAAVVAAAAPARPAPLAKRLRVDLDRLDRLLNLTGELGIARGRMRVAIESLEGTTRDRFIEAMEASDRLIESLQEEVTKIRMVPVGVTFQPHKRTVRDLSSATGKRVALVIEGEDVEIDASLIEQIKDPLTHMIRNAIDHGIESPAVRSAAGKDVTATLTLRAYRDGGGIVIQVRDDGAGFDRKAILARAYERGMISEKDVLSAKAVWSLVFAPGFTTATAVTELSGRGVGMDVVMRSVTALRGSIDIDSEAGHGSTISVRLPLTVAMVDGLAVGAGGERFIIPMDAIEECIELPESIAGDQAAGIIVRRGTPVPFLRLNSFFQLGTPAGEIRGHVVVVRNGEQSFGLVTDVLYGEMQAMIKPLGKLFQSFAGVAGSTIFTDGRVGLILDVPGLVRETARREAATAAH